MNKKKFSGLIIMMLLSIVGIIWVQMVWIRNAIVIRNESFDNAVMISLNNAAIGIENSRKMNYFNNFLFNDPLAFNDTSSDINGFLTIRSYSSEPGNKINVKITNQTIKGKADTGKVTTVNKSYSFPADSLSVSDSVSFIVAPDASGEMRIIKRDDNHFANSGPGDYYKNRKDFQDWLNKHENELRNLSDFRISEIYQWEKILELDNNEVSYMLKRSLAFTGIATPYEYAIIKNGVVQDGTFKKTQKADFLKSKYRISLFPDNILGQELAMSIVFPERTNYVLGSMAWILGGSMLFSLFILATFALSLYFIIRQKKISEMKSDFINNMTHEFKTPIATISLAADTITNPKVINDENSIRHFISMIKKENSRMNKKVETILQIASLDKKEIEFKFENVSLHTIIKHTVDTMDIQVQQRNGTIILNLDAEEPVIYGDSEHLINLVNNFLDNAIKYSPEAPEITVSTKNNEKGVILTIEDKGLGMTKAVQSKIFERFYRQSSGNVHDVKGFGLGLNYSRAIIDAHKGIISVFSEPGKGSRFEIFFPFNCENER